MPGETPSLVLIVTMKITINCFIYFCHTSEPHVATKLIKVGLPQYFIGYFYFSKSKLIFCKEQGILGKSLKTVNDKNWPSLY